MVILDRTTLTPLYRQVYSGNAADAVAAALQITTRVAQGDSIMVIVGALAGSTAQVDAAWLDVLELIVPEPRTPSTTDSFSTSAAGAPSACRRTATMSSPVGHLNAGRGDTTA